jgi:hypothetical protein
LWLQHVFGSLRTMRFPVFQLASPPFMVAAVYVMYIRGLH